MTGDLIHQRLAKLGSAAATILQQKIQQPARAVQIDVVTDDPPVAAVAGQSGHDQNRQICGHGVLADVQGIGNFACRQSAFPGLHQQTKRSKSGGLRQGRQGINRFYHFHESRYIDMTVARQQDTRTLGAHTHTALDLRIQFCGQIFARCFLDPLEPR